MCKAGAHLDLPTRHGGVHSGCDRDWMVNTTLKEVVLQEGLKELLDSCSCGLCDLPHSHYLCEAKIWISNCGCWQGCGPGQEGKGYRVYRSPPSVGRKLESCMPA